MKLAEATSNIVDVHAESSAADILAGLQSEAKRIAPKYFYDQKGAVLFDAITELDEYYVTRVEEQIIRENCAAICAAIGTGANVVEPGAGSCEKIRWLLPDLQPACYTPMDISADHLRASAARLCEEFPELTVVTQACDHTAGLELSDHPSDAPRVFFYPGSSIGNFEPDDAIDFLRTIREQLSAGGGLLIGVDTKKEKDVLHAAYNDSAGITEQFNLNVLDHLNHLLDGDLAKDNFTHVARYDETHGRIEMHLQCKRQHSAELAGEQLEFSAGELIHTENSYKYLPSEFIELAAKADFTYRELWQDDKDWFSVMYFEPA